MSSDISITSELLVRLMDKKSIQIRVGDDGWHKEAASLTKDQAKELAIILLKFAETK
jgi:hypothetical protein